MQSALPQQHRIKLEINNTQTSGKSTKFLIPNNIPVCKPWVEEETQR